MHDTLRRLKLEDDTLVIFTSDNGPVVNDGYDDGADRALDGHKPAGPFRGGKYAIYEGGTRMPFIVRWPSHVKSGVSDALMSELDLLASLASLTHQAIPDGSGEDSLNMLPALLGHSKKGRISLVEEARVLAIVDGPWKLVDRSQRPGAHPSAAEMHLGGAAEVQQDKQSPYPTAPLELYNLNHDPYESRNVAAEHPDIVHRLQVELASLRLKKSR